MLSVKKGKNSAIQKTTFDLAGGLTLLDDVSISLDDNDNDDKGFCIQCKIYI